MPEQIIIASQNLGKLKEIKQLLNTISSIQLFSATDLESTHDLNPVETGVTFAQNASLKARAFARASGLPALADDSGICVAALADFPDVYSARWLAGSDQDRALGLLKLVDFFLDSPPLGEVFAVPITKTNLKSWTEAKAAVYARTARPIFGRSVRYSVVFCYFDPYTQKEEFFTGDCYGQLALKPIGTGGFGYDSIFIPDLDQLSNQKLAQELQGQTFAQLSPQVKNEISHRAQALRKFKDFISGSWANI